MTKRKKIALICVAAALVAGVILGSVFLGLYFAHEPISEYRNVGYIMASTVNNAADVEDLPLHDLTHIIFGFVCINDGSAEPTISEADDRALAALHTYASAHPSVKLMISLNGNGFCYVSRTAERRKAYIQNLKPLVEKYGISGIDADWEYPKRNTNGYRHCIHDGQDYAALMEDIRAEFGKDFALSIALCGSVTFMNDINNRRMAKTLDFVNVMTYDLGLTNHCGYTETASSMFNAYLAGYKKSQLDLGLPFYERCKDKEYDYKEFDELMSMIENGEIEVKKTYEYCYAKYQGHRLSFDTREYLMRKVRLVKKRGYGGVFCWHLGCNADGSLMREARQILEA